MILIIGANGRVGSSVVTHLVAAGEHPRVMVRDVDAAQKRFGPNIDVVAGDITLHETLAPAFEGCDRVFLCTPVDPGQVVAQGNVVRAAKAASAYIIKVSGLGTTAGSRVDSGRWHAETEDEIRAAGLDWTFLHPLFFHQNLSFQWAEAQRSGVLRSAVTEHPIAMINADDIGAVAAALLQRPERGKTFVLTESRAYTYGDVADMFSEVMGRPVRFEAQSRDEVAAALRKSGQPGWHVDLVLQFNDAFNAGLGNVTTTAVEDILHRPPMTLRDHLMRHGSTITGRNPFPS